MAEVILRDLDDRVVETLRRRADARGVSLEQELREIVEQAAKPSRAERVAAIDRIREMTPRRLETDSADLIREDRDSR